MRASYEEHLTQQDISPIIHRCPNKWHISPAWLTAVPTILTLVLGGTLLSHSSIVLDEAITWFVSGQPVSQLIRNSTFMDAMFLPYYLFMHFWLGVSHSPWWIRLPSLLAGAAAVQALVSLARRWLPLGWSVLAGFLLALNPLFAAQTIQARPYTIATLFAVLSMAALVNAIDRGGRRNWALYGLAAACMLLTHLLAILILAAHLAGVAIARRRTAWAGMLTAIGCAVAAVSPLAVLNARESQEAAWIPRSTISTFRWALTAVSGWRAEEVALAICIIIVAVSLARMPSGSDRALGFSLCLTWGTVPGLLLVLVGFVRPIFVPRYEVMAVPGIALIETFAVWRVSTYLTAKLKWRPLFMATLICGAACVAGLRLLDSAVHILQTHSSWEYDYRSAAAELSSDLSKRPAPVAILSTAAGVGFSYYVTPPELAHEINSHDIRTYNGQHMDYWGIPSVPGPPYLVSVVSWPIGAKRKAPMTRCAAGWAIGVTSTPPKTLIVDGSRCLVLHVNNYNYAWVASLNG